MLAVLPALFVALLVLATASRSGFRQGFVYASVIHALCVVCSTEFLSIFGWLTFEAVLTFWTAMTALAAIWLWRYGDGEALRRQLRTATRCRPGAKIMLAAAAIMLAVVLVIALVVPPNNWESMAYRMMRVAMWIDQQSVAHYPTSWLHQLFVQPLVSWQILHLQLLTDGDRFANMPEWIALAGCGIVASLLAKESGQRFSVQVTAAVAAVTLPMGILQGSSSAANLSAAHWLMSFFLLFIQYLRAPTRLQLAGCGLALGFALLSKPTAYMIAPALGLVLVLYGFIQANKRQRTGTPGLQHSHIKRGMLSVLPMAAVGVIALTLNLGHYGRNWLLFEHPISPPRAENFVNAHLDAGILASNLLWNAALQWGIPTNYEFNQAVVDALKAVFGGPSWGYKATIPARLNEVDTPSFLHFWVLTISMVGLCLRRRRVDPLTGYLVVATALSILSFSAVLHWTPYNASYHVPLFMLGAPLVAVFFSLLSPRWPPPLPSAHRGRRRKRRAGRKRRAPQRGSQAAGASPARQREWPLWGISVVFLLASIPWLVFKESAPLLKHDFPATIAPKPIFSTPREELYFNHIGGRGSPTYTDFVHLVDFVASQEPEAVGLHERCEPGRRAPWYEEWFQAYALYMMLKERLENVAVEYFGVANISASLADPDHAPSIILLRTRSRDNRNLDSLDGLIARRIFIQRAVVDMEAWQPVRPFGGTLRTVDMTQLKPEHQRFVCDQFHHETGTSRAFFLGQRLIYLPAPAATAVVDAACKQQERYVGAEPSDAVPTEHIVLHATFHDDNDRNSAQTTNDASRFGLRVQEYRGSLGALAFDVPAQVASISIAELDSDGRVKWQTELTVPDTDAPI